MNPNPEYPASPSLWKSRPDLPGKGGGAFDVWGPNISLCLDNLWYDVAIMSLRRTSFQRVQVGGKDGGGSFL